MKTKNWLSLVLSLAMLFSCAACSSNSPSSETQQPGTASSSPDASNSANADTEKDEIFIGYAMSDMSHEWYQNIKAGMEQYAETLDNVRLQFVDSGFDQAKLVDGAENLINSGIDVLVITPIDPAGCVNVVEQAHQAGIPVICESNPIDGMDTKVSINNYECYYAMGAYAANYVKENNLGKQNILIMGQESYQDCRDRVAGFKQAIADSGIEYEIVQEIDTNGTTENSLELASSVVIAHPEINYIFGINDNTVLGALNACKEAGYNMDDLTLLGGCEGELGRQALLTGDYVAALCCFPHYVGMTLVETAIKLHNGENVPDFVPAKTKILEKEEYSDFWYQDSNGVWLEYLDKVDALPS